MADQANITSLEALESFRTNLIVYLSRTRLRLDEVNNELRRTKIWLQNDQRLFWEGEIRRRRRARDQAEQELLSARLSSFNESMTLQMLAARRARQALEEAETKLQNVKRWTRNYASCTEPLAKKLDSLRNVLDDELPKAITHLSQTQRTLEAYTEAPMPQDAPASAPPTP